MTRVDAHHHFWALSRGDYGWMDQGGAGLERLRRDHLPADYESLRAAHGIHQTVVVQAAPTDAETDFLIGLAQAEPWVAGVVGWVDLCAPTLNERLAALRATPCVKGVRPMLQDIPDDSWITWPEVGRGLQTLARNGLRLDALVKTRHLAHLCAALKACPTLQVVVDHAAKPSHRSDTLDRSRWERELQALAALPQGVCCKVSGLLTELPDAVARDPSRALRALQPVVDFLIDTFGPQRLMWGSDWPVLSLAAKFSEWVDLSEQLLASLNASDRHDIQARTARRFYGLETPL